jgi:hypothetical protein
MNLPNLPIKNLGVLQCPACLDEGFEIIGTHAEAGYALTGNDELEQNDGTADLAVKGMTDHRRGAICLRFRCESGHSFTYIFQQHEGDTTMSIEYDRRRTFTALEVAVLSGGNNG